MMSSHLISDFQRRLSSYQISVQLMTFHLHLKKLELFLQQNLWINGQKWAANSFKFTYKLVNAIWKISYSSLGWHNLRHITHNRRAKTFTVYILPCLLLFGKHSYNLFYPNCHKLQHKSGLLIEWTLLRMFTHKADNKIRTCTQCWSTN